MLRITSLVGEASDPDIGDRLHALSHAGKVEYMTLSRADMSRHRLRAATDKGTGALAWRPFATTSRSRLT